MLFRNYLLAGFRYLTFDKKTIREAAEEPRAFYWGIGLAVFWALLSVLVLVLEYDGYTMLNDFILAGVQLVLGFALIAIVHGVARLLGGKARYTQMYGVWAALIVPEAAFSLALGHTYLSFLVVVHFLLSLLILVASVFAVREIYSLPIWKAIVSVLVPVVLFGMLIIILAGYSALIVAAINTHP